MSQENTDRGLLNDAGFLLKLEGLVVVREYDAVDAMASSSFSTFSQISFPTKATMRGRQAATRLSSLGAAVLISSLDSSVCWNE